MGEETFRRTLSQTPALVNLVLERHDGYLAFGREVFQTPSF